jgi:hypothetical protein
LIPLLQTVPIDRLLLVLFVAGQLWERFKTGERSRRSQGERIGAQAEKIIALEARLTALEASGYRAP